MFFIKFLFYFSLSFFILTIPMSGDPIFYKLEKFAKPVTSKLFTFMKESSKEGIKKGAEATSKLFSNTKPPVAKDKIKTKSSSTKKIEVIHEKYTPEEKEFLENILKKAQ